MNRYLIALLALIAVGTATIYATQPVTSQANNEPHQVRVIWTEAPDTTATISWSTDEEGAESILHFDTTSKGGDPSDYDQQIVVTENGQYADDTSFFHHARLTDLEPDQMYFFVVETDGKVTQEFHFKTAHDDDRTWKLMYGGDSRSSRINRQKMNDTIRDQFASDDEIIGFVHGGDYIAFANTWSQWDAWLTDHELTTTDEGRILPIVPTRGNHEGKGGIYNNVFGNPGGGMEKNYYRTNIGDVVFLTLDSEASQAGDQKDWLEEQLEDSKDARWRVASYHRPAYPAVKSPAGAKKHWVPLFEEHNVDLVCESDGHTLKRTPPIRNDKIDSTGIVYVGEGGLGVRQRTPQTDRWYLQEPGMAISAHHVQVLTFEKDVLRYQAIVMGGDLEDEITVALREERLENKIDVVAAKGSGPGRVEIAFSRPLDIDTALDLGNFQISDGIDIDSAVEGSEVADILRFVNAATLPELDDNARLDSRAAKNIIAFRAGDDGDLFTKDDQKIESMEALDRIKFVGKKALGQLADFTSSGSGFGNPRNAVTLRTDKLKVGKTYVLEIEGVEDVDGNALPNGTSISFELLPEDERADAFLPPIQSEEESSGGCATTNGSDLSWFIVFAALFGFTRRRRRN